MPKSYKEEMETKKILYLRKIMKDLPPFLKDFFRGISLNVSTNTRLAYAYDLRTFFKYLLRKEKIFLNIKIENFSLEYLKKINVDHIENFMEYINYYETYNFKNKKTYKNLDSAKSRKLSAIRNMFSYFYKKRQININPSEIINTPKVNEKIITRLEVNEVSNLLDEIDNGNKLTKKQKDFHTHTKERDLAIVTLLLGTGIRVSECVGIDIHHIDFNINGVKITRKGGNETIVYFGDEVKDALINYAKKRNKIKAKEGFENAFFLSLQNRRITTRSIQKLVKKYSMFVTKFKKISPHKLRSTYGTNLYRKTEDIYLVATVLGHKDVNTTKKYYAAIDEDRKKLAAQYINLRNIKNNKSSTIK